MVFCEKFRREFQRESFFTWNTSRSKLPDMFHVSYVTRVIRPMLGCDVIGETYRKSLLLYSRVNSRVVRLSIGHWCATVKVSHRGFASGRANEAIFVQKWHVSRGETTSRWKIRYGGNAAQTGSPVLHMYRVPQPLTNIFKPRANQVSDQVRQTRDRSSELSFFPVINVRARIVKCILDLPLNNISDQQWW